MFGYCSTFTSPLAWDLCKRRSSRPGSYFGQLEFWPALEPLPDLIDCTHIELTRRTKSWESSWWYCRRLAVKNRSLNGCAITESTINIQTQMRILIIRRADFSFLTLDGWCVKSIRKLWKRESWLKWTMWKVMECSCSSESEWLQLWSAACYYTNRFFRYYTPLYAFFCYIFPIALMCYFGESFTVAWNLNMFRYMVVLHIVWSLNSVAHLWGSKPFDASISPTDTHALGESRH